MNKSREMIALAAILTGTVTAIGCVTTVSPRVDRQPVVVESWGPEEEPFYDDLAPYGDWAHVSGPGWVWVPYARPAGWQPYRAGHWVLTDYGWTWASDEQFGWVVYHYGRWHVDARYGWVWVPGTEWGPAWVAWHEGGGWVGWAPLPWQVRWRAGAGLDWGGLDVRVVLGPSSWCFVPARHVIDPRLSRHVVPATRNGALIRNTIHVTNYTFIDNRVVNQSLKPEKIGRAVGHTIRRYTLEPADAPDAPRGGKVRGGKFVVYRPEAARGPRISSPPPTAGPEPAVRGPRSRAPRAEERTVPEEPSRPDPRRRPSRPRPEAPPDPEPAGDLAPGPPAPPPAAPATGAEKPSGAKKTPPGQAKEKGAPKSPSRSGKSKAGKPQPPEADCDKANPEDCARDEKD